MAGHAEAIAGAESDVAVGLREKAPAGTAKELMVSGWVNG
jgi:hypothetical protein